MFGCDGGRTAGTTGGIDRRWMGEGRCGRCMTGIARWEGPSGPAAHVESWALCVVRECGAAGREGDVHAQGANHWAAWTDGGPAAQMRMAGIC